MEARSYGRRWLWLFTGTIVCGVLSSAAALLGGYWSYPPTDEASGLSFTDLASIGGLVYLYMVALVAVPASVLGLLAARYFLWSSRLELTVPLVGCITTLAALVFGRFSILGVVPVLLVALVAMSWCSERFPARPARARTRARVMLETRR